MKIILEGADGSGKSTLAKELAKITGLEIRWAGPPPVSDYVALSNSIDQIFMDLVIMDRVTPISRLCYQFENTGEHVKDLLSLWDLMKEGSVLIYCTATEPESDDGHRETAHDKFVRDNIEKIRVNYDKFMSSRNPIRYNFREDNILGLISKIMERV